jgi:putative toxin-antitoxin system antitoxin component (TIGR02293 family)
MNYQMEEGMKAVKLEKRADKGGKTERAAASAATEKKPAGAAKATANTVAKTAAKPRQANLFQRLVSGKPVVGGEAIRVIREGFPAAILKEASGYLGVPESRIYKAVHVAPTTANRLLKNEAKIDSAVTERIYRMGNVTRMALEIFEDAERAAAWMRQPNRSLGGAAPLDLMDTEPGALSVRQVLNAIATGGAA